MRRKKHLPTSPLTVFREKILDNYFFKSMLLFAFGGLVNIAALYLIPADVDNIILLGLSRNRLIMAAGLILMTWMAIYAAHRWKGAEKRFFALLQSGKKHVRILLAALSIFFLIGLIILLSPYYRFWQFYYITALIPFIGWITLGLFLCLLPAIILRFAHSEEKFLHAGDSRIQILQPIRIVFPSFLGLLLLILIFRLGLIPDYYFWNENGIPLLLTQIGLSILISFVLLSAISKFQKKSQWRKQTNLVIDTILFLGIWLAAAFVLIATPAERTYFSPGPFPPNNIFYPFSDAMTYDVYAHQALIGEGFAGGQHIGKPLLSALLVLFHTLSGANYSQFYWVQVAIYSIIPAVLYLIGRRLQGYTGGILAGLFYLFLDRNTYQGMLYLSSSHSKLILSEVPTVLCLVLGTFFLVKGLHDFKKSGVAALGVSAGIFGLSTLVRENALILVPLPFFFILFTKTPWRKKFLTTMAMMIFLLAAVTPWSIRTNEVIGSPMYFVPKIQIVILNRRLRIINQSEPSQKTAQLVPNSSLWLSPSDNESGSVSENAIKVLQQQPEPQSLELKEAITQHFFNNLITSFAILPVSIRLEDLNHSALENLNPFPGMNENLQLKPGAFAAILLNFFIISTGISLAWKKEGLGGLVPLTIFFIYAAGLAIARTSGGRYIVGMAWGLLLYYALGIAYWVNWIGSRMGIPYAMDELAWKNPQHQHQEDTIWGKPWYAIASSLLIITIIGSLIPLTEKMFQRRYPVYTEPQTIERLLQANMISLDDYQKYRQLKQDNGLKLIQGRLLYPRFYEAGESIARGRGGFVEKDFPRLHFILLNQEINHIITPMTYYPSFIPDSIDTYVLACKEDVYYAKMILIYNKEEVRYETFFSDPSIPDPCIKKN